MLTTGLLNEKFAADAPDSFISLSARRNSMLVVALHRFSVILGDSPADLAAATNSSNFEGSLMSFGDLPLSSKSSQNPSKCSPTWLLLETAPLH